MLNFFLIVLQNPTLILSLLDLLKSSSGSGLDTKRKRDGPPLNSNVSNYSEYQERLSMNILLLDIFRILFESQSGSFFLQHSDRPNSKYDPSFQWNFVIKGLLETIFAYPFFTKDVSVADRKRFQKATQDPQNFAKLEWARRSDAQVRHFSIPISISNKSVNTCLCSFIAALFE
jgi:hypothetical protein